VLRITLEENRKLSATDELTRAASRRFFGKHFPREVERAARYKRALSLALCDIDHFKKINDTNGHLAGDYVLRELSGVIRPRIRREECFARYGGEEFSVVMPEAGPQNARRFAEKIRKMVEDHPFSFEGKQIAVSISIGVADMTPDMTEPLQFIKVADAALYKAKKEGRNRVCG
jgi:two-component system cell cycle response regulator